MSAVLKLPVTMALAERALVFQALIAATEATDIEGARHDTEKSMLDVVAALKELRERQGRLYLVGNGGSAAVASHAATDLLNVGRLRAATLHDPALLSCMSNDYGFENAFARLVATLASPGDMLIAISSSGQSANIRNAAAEMRKHRGTVVTLSGFKNDNPLRSLGHVNFWLDSADYGMVEVGHEFVLHNIADRLRLGL